MMTRTRLATLLALTAMAGAAIPGTATASSHREAPLISEDPSADNTDLWAFTSPDAAAAGTVTIIAGYIGLEEPGGGPNWLNFSDDVLYEIRIDNNGDGAANDVVYQIRFNTTTNNMFASGPGGTFFHNVGQIDGLPTPAAPHATLRQQTYTVTRVEGGTPTVIATDVPVAPTYAGRFAFGTGGMPATDDTNYRTIAQQAVRDMNTGEGKVFAGPRDDPFFADLGAIFDDATFRNVDLTSTPPSFSNRGGGTDFLSGYNFHMIGLQIPVNRLVRAGTPPTDINNAGNVIGIYATASRPRITIRRDCNAVLRGRTRPLPQNFAHRCIEEGQGQWVQVSRLGIPLVNEVLIPLAEKDFWNRAPASDDVANFGAYLLVPSLPTYAAILYGPSGLRAHAGYAAPMRSASDGANDMLALVKGAPGLIPGVPTAGLAPADFLRLNVLTPPTQLPTNVGNPTLAAGRSRLGAAGGDTQGFPNGRRLFDDVVDIELRYVLNGLAHINDLGFGDGVDGNDVAYQTSFPYVPIPRPGSEGPRAQRAEPLRTTP